MLAEQPSLIAVKDTERPATVEIPITNTAQLWLDHPGFSENTPPIETTTREICEVGLKGFIRRSFDNIFTQEIRFSKNRKAAEARIARYGETMCRGCSFENACPYRQPVEEMPALAVETYLDRMRNVKYPGGMTDLSLNSASRFALFSARRALRGFRNNRNTAA